MSAAVTGVNKGGPVNSVGATEECTEVLNAQSYFDRGKALYGNDFE